MNRSEIETLTKIVQLVVRKEIKSLRDEILTEIRQSKPAIGNSNPKVIKEQSIQKNFRQNYQIQQPTKPKIFSKNPMLNELLISTDPVPPENSGIYQYMEDDDLPNLPTTQTGTPITHIPKNSKVNAVIEAMNRDYTPLVQRMDEDSGKVAQKQAFRNQIISRIENDSEPDEDFSFLNEVD